MTTLSDRIHAALAALDREAPGVAAIATQAYQEGGDDVTHYWWEDHDNIVLVAEWMAGEEDGGPCDVRDLVHFIEKPWHYDEQYELALRAREREQAEEAEQHRRMAPRVAY